MLPLPWWILETNPSDEESDNDETVQDRSETSVSSIEYQDTVPSTPVSAFKTPLSSPMKESDGLPQLYDLSTFMQAAKRRSSTTLEEFSSAKKNKSFPRNETEVMNKSQDGLSILDDTFAILEAEYPETELLDKSNVSLADKSIQPDGDRQNEENELDSPPREYPMFFTSFDDTTVLFNSTIIGDYVPETSERNAAVGDWVFKGNQMLQEKTARKVVTGIKTEREENLEDQIFKRPVKSAKKEPENSHETPVKSPPAKKTRVKKEKEVTKKKGKKRQAADSESPQSVAVVRRQTPSRQAKKYKSLRELF